MIIYAEVEIPDDPGMEDIVKRMIFQLTMIEGVKIKFNSSGNFTIDMEVLKKQLFAILNGKDSRSISFASPEEYELYSALCKVVKAPITGYKP
jgi:hypothetical protein